MAKGDKEVNIEEVKRRFGIVGDCPQLNEAIRVAVQVAKTDLSVLVTGESGTGKENFSKIVHSYSDRKNHKLVALNCGAIPEGTIDSELFGHEKGAYTGAVDTRKGYFETADGSTIFLDEIGEMPLATQAKLLRVLENGEFIRVGASLPMKTDVRVVAATNVNLEERVREGKFRPDLYWRLCQVQIRIPALRDRGGDAVLLFDHFAAEGHEQQRLPLLSLSREAKDKLTGYSWPGNIRELKSLVQEIAFCENATEITADILSKYLRNKDLMVLAPVTRENQESSHSNFIEQKLMMQLIVALKEDVENLKKTVGELVMNKSSEQNWHTVEMPKQAPASAENVRYIEPVAEVSQVVEIPNPEIIFPEEATPKSKGQNRGAQLQLSVEEEKKLIRESLEKYGGNAKMAAIDLKMPVGALNKKIKKYGLQ